MFLIGDFSSGTTFVEKPFEDSVKDAPIIARGIVGSRNVNWANSEDGTRRIYTFFEFQVIEVLKGELISRSIQMRELGGEKDGVGMRVAGTAGFEAGEDVVVFLGQKNSDSSHDVWGMMMGKFNIQKNNDGNEYLSGAGVVPKQHIEGHSDTPSVNKWTVELLRQLIQKQARDENKDKEQQAYSHGSKDLIKQPKSNFPDQAALNNEAPHLQLQESKSPSDQAAVGFDSFWILMSLGLAAALSVMIIFLKTK